MTIKKKSLPETVVEPSYENDDYYAVEKKRIAEETQKAHRIHDLDVQSHLTAMIPYYDDAEIEDRRLLLLVNNLLIHRFAEVGMMYWWIFRHNPVEIREYADLFAPELTESDLWGLIRFLEVKKEELENMVEIWFDEDGEEDDIVVEKNTEETFEDDKNKDEE